MLDGSVGRDVGFVAVGARGVAALEVNSKTAEGPMHNRIRGSHTGHGQERGDDEQLFHGYSPKLRVAAKSRIYPSHEDSNGAPHNLHEKNAPNLGDPPVGFSADEKNTSNACLVNTLCLKDLFFI